MHDPLRMDVQQSIEHSRHDTRCYTFRDGLCRDFFKQFTAFAQFEYQYITMLVVIHLKQTSDVWMV